MASSLVEERAPDVLMVIRLYVKTHGFGPTYRDIGSILNLHVHSVKTVVDYLEREGAIRLHRSASSVVLAHTIRPVENVTGQQE
jgi:DNA-binding transcriptional regulator YhcF (GntR family)